MTWRTRPVGLMTRGEAVLWLLGLAALAAVVHLVGVHACWGSDFFACK